MCAVTEKIRNTRAGTALMSEMALHSYTYPKVTPIPAPTPPRPAADDSSSPGPGR